MKLKLRLKRVPYDDCENCFFYHLTDCNVLCGTKFDCMPDTDHKYMFELVGLIPKDNVRVATLDLGD